MNQNKMNRQKVILETLSIVKLISLLFSSIIFISRCSNFDITTSGGYFNMIICVSIALMLTFLYGVWSFFIINKFQWKWIKWIQYVENFLFVLCFFILVLMSGANESNYKFIFLFIIITSSIQFGIKYGVTLAMVCSLMLLTMDLISGTEIEINQYFENDLILVGVFLLTACTLGYYSKIENKHIEYLSYLANIDGLTELYNHKYFHEYLKTSIERCRRLGKNVALILIDIDYFKNYNDLYGHQKGDMVLRTIGFILKNSVKDGQIACRYGGEEFAIIIPYKDEKYTLNLAESIRKKIEEYKFEGEENQPNGKVTVSIGVSIFPNKSKNENELVNSADDALYRAKFFNKNRVECYYSVLDELKNDIEKEHVNLISSIKTLIGIINAKDRYTYAHVERVVVYSKLLGSKLNLCEEDKKVLEYGAYMHDIGKINISADILNKKVPLSDEEWNIIKCHPKNGVKILQSVNSLEKVIPLIKYHHERYDGKGYPEGLQGEEIPYLVRILTVADSFDAMTSNRPYNKKKNYKDAIFELKRCSGSQFDPKIVEAFIEIVEENRGEIDNIINTV
ncbi:diguanylate cyclase [Clostridium tetanomorphum]|uniref:Diguanylate cyclase n=1 Tax=Clostridium tetanomorphum TaxID=1553 RepID=A0A923E9V1_CLOTT|nr:diguanylate cyclase [Clostridium tetanomorphum]MBC2396545.1 diguanylate cyclase [Clostridium tetanomorphum]NRZ98165.1 diguanylate cyclase (GGDEF)-like protein/putative nucleotidyltransferase with HDIG domain [Clostridium tetanomorphum]